MTHANGASSNVCLLKYVWASSTSCLSQESLGLAASFWSTFLRHSAHFQHVQSNQGCGCISTPSSFKGCCAKASNDAQLT